MCLSFLVQLRMCVCDLIRSAPNQFCHVVFMLNALKINGHTYEHTPLIVTNVLSAACQHDYESRTAPCPKSRTPNLVPIPVYQCLLGHCRLRLSSFAAVLVDFDVILFNTPTTALHTNSDQMQLQPEFYIFLQLNQMVF